MLAIATTRLSHGQPLLANAHAPLS